MRPGDRSFAIAWVALLAASIALSAAVAARDTLPGDVRTLHDIQGWGFPGQTFSDATRAVTTTQVVTIAGFVLVGALALAGARREALLLAALLIVLNVAQPGLKDLIDRPRPSPDVFDRRGSVTSPAFPSGHVMSGTVLYVWTLYLSWRLPWPPAPARVAGMVWSIGALAVVGLVSVWLGVHWPSDVAGGHLWGMVLVLPAIWLNERLATRLPVR